MPQSPPSLHASQAMVVGQGSCEARAAFMTLKIAKARPVRIEVDAFIVTVTCLKIGIQNRNDYCAGIEFGSSKENGKVTGRLHFVPRILSYQ